MGATVYSTPEHLPEPDFGDFFGKEDKGAEAYFAAIAEHTEKLAAWCRGEHESVGVRPGPLVGEVISWPVADGKAQYMVYTTKPLALLHLDYGDGYQVDPIMIRGLRVTDVKEKVRQAKALSEIFGRRS
jgi:hypothetical protein